MTSVMFDDTRQNRPIYFFTGNFAFFFQKFVFSTDSWVKKKWSFILRHFCQNASWSLTKGFSMSVLVGNMGKIGQNLFLRDDNHRFEKIGCRLLRSWTNDHIACGILVEIPRVPWKVVPWRLSCSMIREKNNPMYFFRSKDYLFLQTFCFQKPLRSYRNDLVTSPVTVRTLSDPYNLPLRFVTLDKARKNRPKSFLHWARCFFFQKFMFSTTYFPQKWSYYFHSNSQTTFWTFTNRSLGFVTIDNRRKKEGHFFFKEKVAFFQKVSFSINLLSP